MIYLDSSVALAHLFDETKRPAPEFWNQAITSSRLLEYEVWNRLHSLGHARTAGGEAGRLLALVSFVEMTSAVLARALRPFPIPVRTLDGLHLATMEFLRSQGGPVELATYDIRLRIAADALGFDAASI